MSEILEGFVWLLVTFAPLALWAFWYEYAAMPAYRRFLWSAWIGEKPEQIG